MDAPTAASEGYRAGRRRLDGLHVDVDRQWWPRRVSLDAVAEPRTIEAYRRFREWADERGVEREPGFRRPVRGNAIIGERWTVLETPTICLAVYADADLLAVYPHRADGTVHTVEDGLDTPEAAVSGAPKADADGQPRGVAD